MFSNSNIRNAPFDLQSQYCHYVWVGHELLLDLLLTIYKAVNRINSEILLRSNNLWFSPYIPFLLYVLLSKSEKRTLGLLVRWQMNLKICVTVSRAELYRAFLAIYRTVHFNSNACRYKGINWMKLCNFWIFEKKGWHPASLKSHHARDICRFDLALGVMPFKNINFN